MFIDTHCHLNFPELYNKRREIVKKARDANVNYIITVGTDIHTSRQSIQIAEEFPGIFAAVGVHPTDLLKVDDNWIDDLTELLTHPKVVAIGEIGLDYYWDTTSSDDQKRFFNTQIDIAKSYQMPMIIHNRRADDDMQNILKAHHYFNCVLHCFSSDSAYAQQMTNLGMLLSFTGNITYGSKKLQRVIQEIPLEKMMLETDAPYITPTPYKDKINEPAYIPLIAQKIADIKNQELSKVSRVTTQTALNYFNINQ